MFAAAEFEDAGAEQLLAVGFRAFVVGQFREVAAVRQAEARLAIAGAKRVGFTRGGFVQRAQIGRGEIPLQRFPARRTRGDARQARAEGLFPQAEQRGVAPANRQARELFEGRVVARRREQRQGPRGRRAGRAAFPQAQEFRGGKRAHGGG